MQDIHITTAPTDYEQIIGNYVSIVEKTNEQLSHWVNVSNWTIAGLGVFIALIAIFVGYAIFKNSKEQRDQTRDFFKKLEDRYEEEIKLANERAVTAKAEFEKLIEDQKKKLKSASTEGKKRIEEVIEELEKRKAEVGIFSSPTFVPITTGPLGYSGPSILAGNSILGSGSSSRSMICSKCGESFSYFDTWSNNWSDLSSVSLYSQQKQVHCVHCGAVNIPQ